MSSHLAVLCFVQEVFCPKQCGHTRALTVYVLYRIVISTSVRIEVLRIRVRLKLAASHSKCSCLSKSSKCIPTAQSRKVCLAAAGGCCDCALVVVPCAFSDMVVTFRGRRKETAFLVVQSRLFVTGARDRSGFTSKCRFRGTRRPDSLSLED